MTDSADGIIWAVVGEMYQEIEVSDKVFHFKGQYKYTQSFPITRQVKAQNWCYKMYERLDSNYKGGFNGLLRK